jgi:hypothetical protein
MNTMHKYFYFLQANLSRSHTRVLKPSISFGGKYVRTNSIPLPCLGTVLFLLYSYYLLKLLLNSPSFWLIL